MKVALLHDWTIHMRGGEKVLEALAEMYPEAVIYTLFYNKEKLSPSLQKMKFQTSWLQNVPGIQKYYRWLLPVLPQIAGSMEVKDADLVISSCHCVIKSVRIPKNAKHICYCHTPMRYLWGFENEYFSKFPKFLAPLLQWLLKKLRASDLSANKNVDFFISNSEYVRERIKSAYGRQAEVIYPPLDSFFSPQENLKLLETNSPEPAPGGDLSRWPGDSLESYYLVVSAFVPYKKVDLVIKAFNSLDRKLYIVGKGPMEEEYRRIRKSDKISFLGGIPDPALRDIYSGAKALIFPTEEDFGIVPLEAQACGTPVIAYAKGGALESVKSGVFFSEQTPESIRNAVSEFESKVWNRKVIPGLVESFKKEHFKQAIEKFVNKTLSVK